MYKRQPYEFMYKLLRSGELEQYYEIDPKNSWMLAACEKNIPIIVPGWEDSTMGNIFTSYCIKMCIRDSSWNGLNGSTPIFIISRVCYSFVCILFLRRRQQENFIQR